MNTRRIIAVLGIAAAFVLSPLVATVELGASAVIFIAFVGIAACAAFWPARQRSRRAR